jgi:hypothetical protein
MIYLSLSVIEIIGRTHCRCIDIYIYIFVCVFVCVMRSQQGVMTGACPNMRENYVKTLNDGPLL